MLSDQHDLLDRQKKFDVVIVGSGYGGAISAARLGFANDQAGRKLSICMLERGREHPVGSFPERFEELALWKYDRWVNPLGLFEYIPGDDIDIIQGSGLGGTSLINANVAIRPDEDVFVENWPTEIARDAEQGRLFKYYDRAARMLGAIPFADPSINPLGQELRKIGPFRDIAQHAGGSFELANITVNDRDRRTRYDVIRQACTNCGNCITGCNTGAKNTLAMNYLPMAKACGVMIFSGVEVEGIEKNPGGGYQLHCHVIRNALWRERITITAKRLILSGGSLGTTGILLRSADALGLPHDRLGRGFTGNGDFISLAYNTDRQTDLQGFGTSTTKRAEVKAGPTITSIFKLNSGQEYSKRYTVEDLSCPSPLVDALRGALLVFAPDPLTASDQIERRLKDYRWNTDGAFNHTVGFLIMGHDQSDGRIVLKHGQTTVEWSGAADEGIYPKINEILEQASADIGGSYIPNPRWQYQLLGRNLVTAHPLGGAATADSAAGGVVDHVGRVFDDGGGVLPGLYVTDGSIIPKALGVNPFLTISAFTERMIDALRAEPELGLPQYDQDAEGDDVA